MTVRHSSGLRNYGLDSGLGTAFDSGKIDFYTGSQPAGPDSAETGTLLASEDLPADAFAAAASGAIAKNGTWQVTAVAAGTAGWFRIRQSGDAGGASSTARRIDGSVTATGGGGDMTFDVIVWSIGGTVTVTAFTITYPAS